MDMVKVIELKQSVFQNSNEKAALLRKKLKENKFFSQFNVSPGSRKTATYSQQKNEELLEVSTLDLIITEAISFCDEYKKTHSTKHGNMSTPQK